MICLKIASIAKNSVVDGPGIRYTIFTQGCYHNCPECHNQTTHNPNDGKLVDIEDLYNEIINSDICDGVTFSGGEPFLQSAALFELAIKIKRHTKLNIICYTGYTYEEIQKIITDQKCQSHLALLNSIDYLVDGKFDKDKKSLECKWRGSTNQRIIDVKETLRQNKVVEADI